MSSFKNTNDIEVVWFQHDFVFLGFLCGSFVHYRIMCLFDCYDLSQRNLRHALYHKPGGASTCNHVIELIKEILGLDKSRFAY